MQPHFLPCESSSYGGNGIVNGDEVVPKPYNLTASHTSDTAYSIYPFQQPFTQMSDNLPREVSEGIYTNCAYHDPTGTASGGHVNLDKSVLDNEEEDGDVHAGRRCGRLKSLHLNSSVVGRLKSDPLSLLNTADPVTMALLRRRQQELNGEPATPLSPRTLQSFVCAAASGGNGALDHLTVDDVLAPVPLALTWYPTPEPSTVLHDDRKRYGEEPALEGPARKRSRLQPPLPGDEDIFTPSRNAPPPECGALPQPSLPNEDGAQGNRARFPTKRQREENVFEYVTRGPRFH